MKLRISWGAFFLLFGISSFSSGQQSMDIRRVLQILPTPSPCQKRVEQLPAPQFMDWHDYDWADGDDHHWSSQPGNGEVQVRATDLVVPSRGFDFVWMRAYSSRADFDHGHGANWDFTYNRRACVQNNGDVAVSTGFGREDIYKSLGGGAFQSPRGIFNTLIQNLDTTYTEFLPNGTEVRYGLNDYLESITDRHGNTLSIQRNAFDNIDQITDTQGRTYTVGYTTAGADQKIQSLTDFAGREWYYSYDAAGNLISARSPLVTGTPNGNDFPLGKTRLYTYSSGFSNNRLNHNLTSIIDPLYNVGNNPALSKASVTFTYQNGGLFSDRVKTARIGHDQGGPPSNPNLVVGGTRTWTYSNSVGLPTNPTGGKTKAELIDELANHTDMFFDARLNTLRVIDYTNRDIRPGEPDYTTDYRYNNEDLLKRVDLPRGNIHRYIYDLNNSLRRSQANLLVMRRKDGSLGNLPDLVTALTYEPAFNQVRTVTDPRAFPTGIVPKDANGNLDLADPLVARYTTYNIFDYQEGTGFQNGEGIPPAEQIPEGLGDQNGAPDFDEGNVVKSIAPQIQDPISPNFGDQSSATFSYNDLGQLLTHKDPEGTETLYSYFPAPGPKQGYLQSRTVDPPGLALQHLYDYTDWGALSSYTDPKSQAKFFTTNALTQVVRLESRQVAPGLRYKTDFYFDANDNLVEIQHDNLDGDGTVHPNPTVDHTFEYDILKFTTSAERERTHDDGTDAGTIRTEYGYDASMNQILVRLPEASNGSQPDNRFTVLYDERDLPARRVFGDDNGDPTDTPPPTSIWEWFHYDENGNLTTVVDNERKAVSPLAPANPYPSLGSGDVWLYDYDAYDRLLVHHDAEGNRITQQYDLASNVIHRLHEGHKDHISSVTDPFQIEERLIDEMNRTYRTRLHHFAIQTGSTIGDGFSTTLFEFDLDSKLKVLTDDRSNQTSFDYDDADRLTTVTDALGNDVTYGYDDNSNITTVTATESSTDLGSAADTYVHTNAYDALDRLTQTTDAAGNVRNFTYDSKNALVEISDGVRGTGHPIGPGNIIRKHLDGLSRVVRIEYDLTMNGRGDGSHKDVITVLKKYDDNSRLIELTDSNLNTTAYEYDAMNRLFHTTYADGTDDCLIWDIKQSPTSSTDQNGTVINYTYDGLDRLLTKNVTPAAGVGGSLSETYGYDGAGRITLAQNEDWLNPGANITFNRDYDSLGNLIRETRVESGDVVDLNHDGVSNLTQITYPHDVSGPGRRVVDYTYDALNRVGTIDSNGARVVTNHYKGPRRLEQRKYGPVALPIATTGLSYDAMRRVTEIAHAGGPLGPIATFQYGYDKEHHRLFEKRVHNGNIGDVYAYDSIYRITGNLHNVDLSAIAPGDEILPEIYSSADNETYDYDGVGNRVQQINTAAGISTILDYVMNLGGYAEVNQYTRVEEQGQPIPSDWVYDENGNLVGGSLDYSFESHDLLIEAKDPSSGQSQIKNVFDAFGRRIRKETPAGTMKYSYAGFQVIEEKDGTDAVIKQHTPPPEPVKGNNRSTVRPHDLLLTTGQFFLLGDANGSTTHVIDSFAIPVDRNEYDSSGNLRTAIPSTVGNEFLYRGMRQDPETGLYALSDGKYYDPELGRSLQTGGDSLGNQYTYSGNDGVNGGDSSQYGYCEDVAQYRFTSSAGRNQSLYGSDSSTAVDYSWKPRRGLEDPSGRRTFLRHAGEKHEVWESWAPDPLRDLLGYCGNNPWSMVEDVFFITGRGTVATGRVASKVKEHIKSAGSTSSGAENHQIRDPGDVSPAHLDDFESRRDIYIGALPPDPAFIDLDNFSMTPFSSQDSFELTSQPVPQRSKKLYVGGLSWALPGGGETSRWNIEGWHLEAFTLGPFNTKGSSNLMEHVDVSPGYGSGCGVTRKGKPRRRPIWH